MKTKQVKILSRHKSFADAVAAANFSREGYELRNPGGAEFLVTEPFSRSAEIYGDKAEILFVFRADMDLLHRFQLGACTDDSPFTLIYDKGDSLEWSEMTIRKTRVGRLVIADMQKLIRETAQANGGATITGVRAIYAGSLFL